MLLPEGGGELKSEGGGSHRLTCTHTSADQPCILSVVTVAPAPGASGTVSEGFLSSSTPHIVHPHGSLTRSKSGTPRCGQCSPTSQLPTSHSCISEVPSIIADSAPTSTVPDFQAASTSMGTRDQTQPLWGGYRQGRRKTVKGYVYCQLGGGRFQFVHLEKPRPRKSRGLRVVCQLSNLEKRTAIPLGLIEEGSRRGCVASPDWI